VVEEKPTIDESKCVVNPVESHPARLLIVDDEPALLRAMRRVLEAAAPEWTVVCARDGAEALDRLARDDFDAVVLDLHMPVMDGLTLLRHLAPNYPKVRRIVHSSHIEPTGRELLNQLAHEVVAKPAHPGEILEALRRALLGEASCEGSRREGVAPETPGAEVA